MIFNLMVNVGSTPLKELPVSIVAAEWMLGMLWSKSLTARKLRNLKSTQEVYVLKQIFHLNLIGNRNTIIFSAKLTLHYCG